MSSLLNSNGYLLKFYFLTHLRQVLSAGNLRELNRVSLSTAYPICIMKLAQFNDIIVGFLKERKLQLTFEPSGIS